MLNRWVRAFIWPSENAVRTFALRVCVVCAGGDCVMLTGPCPDLTSFRLGSSSPTVIELDTTSVPSGLPQTVSSSVSFLIHVAGFPGGMHTSLLLPELHESTKERQKLSILAGRSLDRYIFSHTVALNGKRVHTKNGEFGLHLHRFCRGDRGFSSRPK